MQGGMRRSYSTAHTDVQVRQHNLHMRRGSSRHVFGQCDMRGGMRRSSYPSATFTCTTSTFTYADTKATGRTHTSTCA
jgi:hypothetical protein